MQWAFPVAGSSCSMSSSAVTHLFAAAMVPFLIKGHQELVNQRDAQALMTKKTTKILGYTVWDRCAILAI